MKPLLSLINYRLSLVRPNSSRFLPFSSSETSGRWLPSIGPRLENFSLSPTFVVFSHDEDASVVTVAPGGLFEFIPVWLACWVADFFSGWSWAAEVSLFASAFEEEGYASGDIFVFLRLCLREL
ncbi:unnamed protein product [Arabidopsis thaliana]|uniref:Uncharacterized protein n=1 Tax=Arabidopsis thaliana TaxID=3702 RepID=A0A5S9Y5E4_ARATH|nr:unnamed protein product [Arabidopsis thaliana]